MYWRGRATSHINQNHDIWTSVATVNPKTKDIATGLGTQKLQILLSGKPFRKQYVYTWTSFTIVNPKTKEVAN